MIDPIDINRDYRNWVKAEVEAYSNMTKGGSLPAREPIYYNQEITDAFKNRALLDRIEKLEKKVETMETYFFKRLVEVIEESLKK